MDVLHRDITKPTRVQRKRSKGFKMPENTIYVGRPSRWGNPFEVKGEVTPEIAKQRFAIHLYSYFGWIDDQTQKHGIQSHELAEWIKPLRGKKLACWCPLDQPCHADILLMLANM